MKSAVTLCIAHYSNAMILKRIFVDSNDIFWWHELQDINKKAHFSVDSKFTFTSYTWVCCVSLFHRLLCWINSRRRELIQHSSLTLKRFKLFLRENVLLREELQKSAKNSNFEKFEGALFMKSLSILILTWQNKLNSLLSFFSISDLEKRS